MNTRLIISLLCAGALAFACGPRSHSEAPTSLASALPLHRSPSSSKSDTPTASSEHRSKKDKSKLPPAKIDSKLNVAVTPREVKLALDVRNTGGRHAELDFPNGQTYDFVVVDSVGREVWRWSTRRMFTQGVRNKQLGTGEAMQVSESWKDAKPGKYTAIAQLKSSNYPVEQRIEFVMH